MQSRKAARQVAAAGDDGTNDLLVSDVLRTHEMQVWFWRNTSSIHLVQAEQPCGDIGLHRAQDKVVGNPNQALNAAGSTATPAEGARNNALRRSAIARRTRRILPQECQ